jgi:hypothetical protein
VFALLFPQESLHETTLIGHQIFHLAVCRSAMMFLTVVPDVSSQSRDFRNYLVQPNLVCLVLIAHSYQMNHSCSARLKMIVGGPLPKVVAEEVYQI